MTILSASLARVAILSAVLLGCGSHTARAQRIAPPTIAPAMRVDPVRLLHEASGKLHGPKTFVIGEPADGQPFSQRDDGTITVDRRMVAQIETPEEALALAAIVQTYAGNTPPALRTRDSVSAGEVVAGLLAGGVGSTLERRDSRIRYLSASERQAYDKQHALGWAPRASETTTTRQVQATRTLTLLDRAGGCSGALEAILTRIAGNPHSTQTTSPGFFARSVLHDLGASIRPPETSCIRRR
ncbi:MAG: hypothetical protein PGN12_05160 [Sphingomonas phyllosphaerae]